MHSILQKTQLQKAKNIVALCYLLHNAIIIQFQLNSLQNLLSFPLRYTIYCGEGSVIWYPLPKVDIDYVYIVLE